MKNIFFAIFCLLVMTVLVGCNTIKGVGEDLQAVGGWFVKGSDSVQKK